MESESIALDNSRAREPVASSEERRSEGSLEMDPSAKAALEHDYEELKNQLVRDHIDRRIEKNRKRLAEEEMKRQSGDSVVKQECAAVETPDRVALIEDSVDDSIKEVEGCVCPEGNPPMQERCYECLRPVGSSDDGRLSPVAALRNRAHSLLRCRRSEKIKWITVCGHGQEG